MKNYIWIVSEHRHINGGEPVTTNHYYHAESEDKAKGKYESLCANYTDDRGYKCVYDDRFGTIEDVAGEEFYTSFRDFVRDGKNGKSTCQVEIGVEYIK